MDQSAIRILVIDDFVAWRQFLASLLQGYPQLRIVDEASNAEEGVQKAKQLQPDLVLLDIGLPESNGIEVARQIRSLSPKSKILFISENRAREIVEAALAIGSGGYVLKSDSAEELIAAVKAVLCGRQFLSSSLKLTSVPRPSASAAENQTRQESPTLRRRKPKAG